MGRVLVECPLNIGQRITVSPNCPFAPDWRGEYIVTAIRWEYQCADGRWINISIASEEDIANRRGSVDGWTVTDLIPVNPKVSPHAG